MTAGSVKTRAAMATRVVTAAAGVQPAASRLAANEPEVPKVALERRAMARPTLLNDRRTTCLRHRSSKDLRVLRWLQHTVASRKESSAFRS